MNSIERKSITNSKLVFFVTLRVPKEVTNINYSELLSTENKQRFWLPSNCRLWCSTEVPPLWEYNAVTANRLRDRSGRLGCTRILAAGIIDSESGAYRRIEVRRACGGLRTLGVQDAEGRDNWHTTPRETMSLFRYCPVRPLFVTDLSHGMLPSEGGSCLGNRQCPGAHR